MESPKQEMPGPGQALFYDAFRASPIGIALENLEGRPLFVNPALCSMLGFTEEEMRQKHCVEFSPDEDAQKDWALFEQLKAGVIDRYTLEKRFFKRDGSVVWGRLSISMMSTVSPPLVVAMVEDVTPIRESEERFRLLTNSAPVMIWSASPDGSCTYFNRPWLDFTGRPMEAELGLGWIEGVHPEDRQRCQDTYNQAFHVRQPFTMEFRFRRHDGEYRWLLDSGVPRFERDGSFAGFIGSALDIAERKAVEEARLNLGGRLIEAQEQERRHIARELHDDISQRLVVLSLDLQKAASTVPDSEEVLQTSLKTLVNAVSKLNVDVHALSYRLHASRLQLLGLAATMSYFCKELAAQRDVEISFTHNGVPADLPEAISLCLFRILQEALNNAVKHSGTRQFESRLSRIDDYLQLTVVDHGAGFDPGAATYSKGLGLISMIERATLVRGTVSVASQPGLGTEITCRVPLPAQGSPKAGKKAARNSG